ncbi:hypothetical protein ACWEVP_25455 [Amycolatopsis sp. NPDC003865]
MQGTFGQVEFVPLPPRFADRVRAGSVVVGCTMIAAMVLLVGLTTFLEILADGHLLPDSLIGKGAAVLPPLGVLAIAVLVLTSRRCLRGDYLVVATAATARTALLFAYVLTLVLILGLFAAPIVFRLRPDVLTTVATFAFATLGYVAGTFFVRPSVQTLRKFSDHPMW